MHYLLGYLIRFLLIDIPWLVDFEFCLWHWCLRRVYWYLAKIVTEAWFYKRLSCCVSLHIPGTQQVEYSLITEGSLEFVEWMYCGMIERCLA